jgi:small redox-active disulfide protein 2
MNVKILGTGCSKCIALDKAVRELVKELNLDITVEKIEDIQKIISYSVLTTPALVINEKVVSTGKVLNKKEIAALIAGNK